VGGEGIDLNTLESLEGVVAGGQHQQGEVIEECRTGEDAEKSRDCRLIGTVNSIQASWSEALEGYRPAVTVFFSDSTNTGCGVATADVGPFYCPADQKVYVDLGFFQELQARFGAGGGPFAEAYVLAHEYGHHVQKPPRHAGPDRRRQGGASECGRPVGAPGRLFRWRLGRECGEHEIPRFAR
jgi:predicted metalloprotease